MWITNKLGYDITLSGVTLYKNSQQEISVADATTLNKDAVFTAMITAGTGLVKTDNQPDVNPQYFVRALDTPVTLDGMPTNPNGYPMVSPAQAFNIGKEEGGDADLENNKVVTIDVSDYTDPVEVTPTSGKDGMKKATVTLDNIPSGANLEANHAATINVGTYTDPVEIEPTAGKDGMEKVTVTLNNIPELSLTYPSWLTEGNEMSSIVPDGIKVSVTNTDNNTTQIYTGDGTKTLFQLTEYNYLNHFFGAYGQSAVISAYLGEE